jgi:post-segregation antitoxin (ccd killing protein)
MQVYLPDDLYEQLKSRGLPASELLQEAVRGAVHRQDLLAETDSYLTELAAEVGAPSARERSRAAATSQRIARRRASRAS